MVVDHAIRSAQVARFCSNCKVDASEVVMAGEKLKESKRKSTLVSYIKKTKRDWGRGMACVGRTKECTLVPRNHYGPIPGVEASEAGVHRPHVAGIHGRETDGAYSIVLSGGYEDDLDNGEEFLYTGSGGRDLSGNKRTAEQSCDQELTRNNRALAMNCDAPVDEINGAKSKDWRVGKPVRVVRSHKLKAHSAYAPEKGCRYDGIYKVVEYWKERGKSGFFVWRYLLRRDDEVPAPWTEEGKKRIESLGLQVIYPDGYQEAMGLDKKKRKTESPEKKPKKSKKAVSCELPPDVEKLMNEDCNKKLWNECKAVLSEGKPVCVC
ncbi:hypothetical protein J437_LFUL004157 [Ladona fulva]|uniref:YDG domain-containing protein n=1 Tax=Ladona fulva TaxID=123851 RepID=A0A8K0K0G0_LADFU|nr:hypothetical protein J437_LFUL004157 [Ladona fulva]